ncbi:MAG: hypothetical protein H0W67_10615, partial [Gemmatimonadales bacterium]|nr:hypothetical protein [Gemmatimonadales bacterium]
MLRFLPVALLLATACSSSPVDPANGPQPPSDGTAAVLLQEVATGLTLPLYLTFAPADSSRVFIVEKPGRIRVVKNGTLLPDPFLDVTSLVSTGGEQGLLGLA